MLTKSAISATLHCLTGCAIGEILGMVVSNALNLSIFTAVVISIALAFVFGYALSMYALIKVGLSMKKAFPVALAADTLSITSMEIVDNFIMVVIPGAITAGLMSSLFWLSLITSLIIAFIVTVPINRWLISHGRGHAVAHQYHHMDHH